MEADNPSVRAPLGDDEAMGTLVGGAVIWLGSDHRTWQKRTRPGGPLSFGLASSVA